MTILLQLRNAARECSKASYAQLLRSAADVLQASIKRLHDDPTYDNAIVMNNAWSYAHRLLANVPPEAAPTPPTEDVEEIRIAA